MPCGMKWSVASRRRIRLSMKVLVDSARRAGKFSAHGRDKNTQEPALKDDKTGWWAKDTGISVSVLMQGRCTIRAGHSLIAMMD